ncbi:hypothetical protein KQX54_014275 [Cotesia glomerata]|uniref:Uncharacterized protein n=1 Tax=Cotesia glomerata TaxID=32391 RepID=A0AAV7IBY0_COTGL|nr:hypothetical protein KQX54_014275 [Cotesia glomerata]
MCVSTLSYPVTGQFAKLYFPEHKKARIAYEKRPLQHPEYDFAEMSLTEFAMLFELFYPKKVSETEESVDHDAYEEQPDIRRPRITLSDGSKMVVRNVPAVVRVPYFIATSDPENFYSLLVQYMPYRLEPELLEGFDNAKEAFLARENRLKETSRHMRQHRERDQQLENAFIQVHAFEILEQPEVINPEAEEEELPDRNEQ